MPFSCNSHIHSANMRAHEDCPTPEIMNNTFDQFGPTPRLCLDLASMPTDLVWYQATVRSALQQLGLRRLQELAYKVGDLGSDDISHHVCLVMREDRDEINSGPIIKLITDNIQSRLAITLRGHTAHKQIDWYHVFARNPTARGLGGHLFEAFCQRRFQTQINIKYVPMVRLDSGDDRARKPKWHTSHNSPSEELEAKRLKALKGSTFLKISPSKTDQYDHLKLEELDIKQDTFYIPASDNAEAVDSFICHNNHLYLFQFTVSDDHDIKPGFFSRFTKCNKIPPRENWHFIFIIPDDVKVLKCRYLEIPGLQNFQPYSSQVKLEDYDAKEGEPEEEGPAKKSKLAEAPAEGPMASEGQQVPEKRKWGGSNIFTKKGKEKQK